MLYGCRCSDPARPLKTETETELYHIRGRAQAAHAREGPAAPDPAGARHKLRAFQGQQGLGGPEQDGWLVSSLFPAAHRVSGNGRADTSANLYRLITLNGMKASEELTEEQARQVGAGGLGGSCAALILAFTVVVRHRACIRRVLQESEWEGRAVVKLQVECCS